MSHIWNYFEVIRSDDRKEKKGRCLDKNCKGPVQILKCTDGNTKTLIGHLKSYHSDKHREFNLLTAQSKEEKALKQSKHKREDSSSLEQMKQPKLMEALERNSVYGSDHVMQKEFDSLFTDVIVEGFLAFGFSDLPSVHNLIRFLNKRVVVKHSTTYSRQMEEKHEVMIKKLKRIIMEKIGTSCAFTSDLWTSRAQDSFISLTIHFIDEMMRLHRWTPYCRTMGDDRHTGENISEHLDAMIEDLSINDQEQYCVTDNAANIMLGVRTSNLLSEDCKNHTLQLVINDSFKNVDGMQHALDKTKAIAALCHKSSNVNNQLHSYCDRFGHRPNAIPQQNATRWNSSYYCMKATLLHKQCIDTMGTDEKLPDDMVPSLSEWKMIEGACEVLGAFEETTKIWEMEKRPTLNLVTKRIYNHTVTLQEYIENKKNKGYGILFARELLKQLNQRFPEHGLCSDIVAYANILDPRLKGVHLRVHNKLEPCCNTLENIAQNLGFLDKYDESSTEKSNDQNAKTALTPLDKLKKKYAPNLTANETLTFFQEEIKRYLEFPEPIEDNDKIFDILQWWHVQKSTFPTLHKLAKHYLCIPAASSKSERVFSCGGNTVTTKRTRLEDKKVEMLVVLKSNQALVKNYENY